MHLFTFFVWSSSQDSNFTWANAGAAVFGAPVAPATKTKNSGAASDEEEAPDNVDIHFEPIVSLPEVPFERNIKTHSKELKSSSSTRSLILQVETKSGEEDEEILFKERTKLFRWDRENNQWKERGVGDIKILFHPTKHSYRVLMRRDQVLRVCANHTITQLMELKPMNTSTNALIWTATDYAGKVEGTLKLGFPFSSPSRTKMFAVGAEARPVWHHFWCIQGTMCTILGDDIRYKCAQVNKMCWIIINYSNYFLKVLVFSKILCLHPQTAKASWSSSPPSLKRPR